MNGSCIQVTDKLHYKVTLKVHDLKSRHFSNLRRDIFLFAPFFNYEMYVIILVSTLWNYILKSHPIHYKLR